MPGGNKVLKCRIDASPPRGMMKHLEEAFTGSWHMYEKAWGGGCWAGDSQLQQPDVNMSTLCRQAEGKEKGTPGGQHICMGGSLAKVQLAK